MPDTASLDAAPPINPPPNTALPDFTIPRSFSPSHSLIGRLIRHQSGDRLRGEALYIFIVTMASVGWLLVSFAAWALLADRIAAAPTGPVALAFFAVQVGGPVLGFLVAGVGFRPEISIRLNDGMLNVSRGTDGVDVPLDNVISVRSMDAVTYHRGLRLLESTQPFINRPVASVLVFAAGDMNIALGLEPQDHAALVARLTADSGTP